MYNEVNQADKNMKKGEKWHPEELEIKHARCRGQKYKGLIFIQRMKGKYERKRQMVARSEKEFIMLSDSGTPEKY